MWVPTKMPAVVLGAVLACTLASVAAAEPPRDCRGIRATIVGTSGDDELRGTSGRDVIVGGGGEDEIQGRAGRDLVCANGGKDLVDGGDGRDRIFGGHGNDWLEGGYGRKDQGHNVADGKRDLLHGGRHTDTCSGNSGDRTKRCESFVVE